SREEGVELLRRLDPRLEDALAAELWERAKGSPFWLESLARATGGVAGLGQVLTMQLRGAGADAGRLLGLLAVAGRPLSLLDAGSDLRQLGRALEHRRAAGLPTFDLALRLARSPQRKLLGPEGLRLLAGIADDADPFAEKALELREEVASLATDLAEHEEALARWALVADRAEAPL